jgi:phosphopantetheinyl transferase (holo-ACP synthase)
MGTDICEVQRIRRVLSDKNQAKVEKFGRKIFSENEMPGFLDRAKTVQDLEHLSSGEDEAATSYCKYQREL